MKNIQQEHFDSKKNQYLSDKIFNPPNHVIDEINEIIFLIRKYSSSNSVVDFGSGNGRLTIPLLKSGFKVTSVDVSNKSLLNLYHNAKKIKKQNKLKTKLMLPLSSKLICGTDILHHVDIKNYFNLFYRSLSKNGIMVFSEPNILNLSWILFVSLFLDWEIEKRIFQINYFNLIKQLKTNGFKEIKIIGLFLFPPILFNKINFLKKINLFFGNLPILKLFAFRYIIIARR